MRFPWFFTRQTPHGTKTHPFRRVAARGRCRAAWRGVLPATPRREHFLRADALYEPDERGKWPFRFDPTFSHEIWLGWRLLDDSPERHLLFHGQFDFGGCPGSSSDAVAWWVTDYLAHELMKAKRAQSVLLYDPDFWALAVEAKYRSLRDAPRT